MTPEHSHNLNPLIQAQISAIVTATRALRLLSITKQTSIDPSVGFIKTYRRARQPIQGAGRREILCDVLKKQARTRDIPITTETWLIMPS